MTKFKLLFTAIIMSSILLTSCEKDDPEVPNEEELITTINYTLTPNGDAEEVVLTFRDLDGDGGDTPEITSGTLRSNLTYSGQLELLNESEDPVEDITAEIEEEDDEHQFFFSSTISDLTVAYNDQDGDGNPVGLKSTITTGAASSGSMTLTLRHEPNKAGSGVAGGDITNAGGETDIEVTFQINVQ